MKIETLELIHALLKREKERAERIVKAIQENKDATDEQSPEYIVLCREWREAVERTGNAKAALEDFETHEF